MKHSTWLDLGTVAVLVACGATARLALQEYPNFAPVAAIAFFAGFFIRDMRLAAVVPLAIMTITDLAIGVYNPFVMAAVYAALTLPVVAGPWLRRWLKLEGPTASELSSSASLIYACSFAGSCLFFLVTNGAEWIADCFRDDPTYAASVAGLARCLWAGVPFFKYTLLADLFFATLFFGAYAAAVNLGWLLDEEPELSKSR